MVSGSIVGMVPLILIVPAARKTKVTRRQIGILITQTQKRRARRNLNNAQRYRAPDKNRIGLTVTRLNRGEERPCQEQTQHPCGTWREKEQGVKKQIA